MEGMADVGARIEQFVNQLASLVGLAGTEEGVDFLPALVLALKSRITNLFLKVINERKWNFGGIFLFCTNYGIL